MNEKGTVFSPAGSANGRVDVCEILHEPSRRQFVRNSALLATGTSAIGLLATAGAARANGAEGAHGHDAEDPAREAQRLAVLVDMTACIGCRRCEHACKQTNGFDAGSPESYDDQSVFRHPRRPAPDGFTVVNAYADTHDPAKPVYAKVNCMHCRRPACVSACIVGALQQQPNGAVTYDAWKCIGCRYCMVACPFQIPAYEYDNVLTPRVRKCEFCVARTSRGERPACVAACPREALTFGRRTELLQIAHEKLNKSPQRYEPHVYGEHEVGGTSWMYLSPVPFEQAGFLPLGKVAPPVLTEAIQHGVFKHWIAPIGWYSFLSLMMFLTGRRAAAHAHRAKPEPSGSAAGHPRHHESASARPIGGRLFTPGVIALLAMVIVGFSAMLYRFVVGLAATTNLDQQHPWGLWIAMDVGSGIALAGGGFVTAALVHVFHREHYHSVARSALLTALLGYTFYVPGLLADIGRWYNIWHPTIPTMWQGNSVLFEVGICVMLYLNVQYAELAPIVLERLLGEGWLARRPRLRRLLDRAHGWFEFILPALLVLGVALSTFHQSSLGNLIVIAPYKLHALWWTPVSPVLFLLSAMMVGFPMVIFTILFASWSLRREPEMHVLAPLARYVPVFLAVYLAVRVGDLVVRGVWPMLGDGSVQSLSCVVELALGVVAPLAMLLIPRVRRSPRWLAASCLTVILGVILNRLNVFIIGYHPPYAAKSYVPSLIEFLVSMGLVAALMLVYRVGVTYLPILEPRPQVARKARAAT